MPTSKRIRAVLAVSVMLCTAYPLRGQTQTGQDIEQHTHHRALQSPEAAQARIPPGVALSDGLSEDEAVAIALWNNAVFHNDLAALGIARADLIEAGLLRNPLLSLLLPLTMSQLEATITFPAEVFFQRPRRVAAAKAELERVAQSLEQNALNLVRDVRVAYSDLLLARNRARV